MEENKTPTARQILNKYKSRDLGLFNKDIEEAMIEFGKLHVEAALKAAANNAKVSYSQYGDMDVDGVNKDSIYDAYPLENIK
jgi:hypothetical protein